MRYLDKLSEAKKRGYTYQEVDAYARGREKATIARRKKEFEDFKDEVIKKSKEEKKKKVEEARTIPKQKGGGYSKKTTSPDRRVSPTEKSLEGEGLSRAEYRKRMKKKVKTVEEARVDKGKPYGEKTRARSRRNFERAYQHASDTGEGKVGKMIRSKDFRKTAVLAARARRKEGAEKKLKAEAYIQLGDVLAEAMSDKAKKVVKKLKTSAEKSYRSAEVGEASGESAKSVKKKSAKAHKRMAKAQEIEGKG
jgi:hypothetical protein